MLSPEYETKSCTAYDPIKDAERLVNYKLNTLPSQKAVDLSKKVEVAKNLGQTNYLEVLREIVKNEAEEYHVPWWQVLNMNPFACSANGRSMLIERECLYLESQLAQIQLEKHKTTAVTNNSRSGCLLMGSIITALALRNLFKKN